MVKPDQLIKRRGKLGLIKVNVSYDDAIAWIGEKMGKEIQVSGFRAVLNIMFRKLARVLTCFNVF